MVLLNLFTNVCSQNINNAPSCRVILDIRAETIQNGAKNCPMLVLERVPTPIWALSGRFRGFKCLKYFNNGMISGDLGLPISNVSRYNHKRASIRGGKGRAG